MMAKALWTLHLEALEQRLRNPRRLSEAEQISFDQLFSAEQLADIAARHRQLEAEYPERAVEAGLTELPKQSRDSDNLSGDRKEAQRQFRLHRERVEALTKEAKSLLAKADWEAEMARSIVNGEMWKYNRLSDADKRFWEPPLGNVEHVDELPDYVEHIALLIWPDEPIAKRRAMLEALTPLVEAAQREDEE